MIYIGLDASHSGTFVNRGEPYEQIISYGDVGSTVNRGEPYYVNYDVTMSGVASAIAIPPAIMWNVPIVVASAIATSPDVTLEANVVIGPAIAVARAIQPRIGEPIVEEIIQIRKVGQSGTKRAAQHHIYDETIVWARLIRVNDEPPQKKVEGYVRIKQSQNSSLVLIEGFSTRVRKSWEDVKINIVRVK